MLHFLVLRPLTSLRLALLVALCVLSLAAGAQAQQRSPVLRLSPEDASRGLNGVQKNFFFTTGNGTTEDEYQNAGFFGQRLRPYLASNQEALDHLNQYRRQKWLFLVERLTFVGAVGLYAQQVLAKDSEQQYFNGTQRVAVGVAAASLLSNIFISRNTNSHFQRAIESHNAGLPAARQGAIQWRPSAVGLAASRTGQPLLTMRWNLR